MSASLFLTEAVSVASINSAVNSFVWGVPVLSLLIAAGVLMTCLTKGFQFSHFIHWWKNTIGSVFKKDISGHSKEKGSISQFQALCTALAATVGVGNIAGVAAAISVGGAGAVFWMWLAAIFGTMTNFSENVLGIFFRRKNANGEWAGGAMYYLRDGVGGYKGCKSLGKFLAGCFAVFAIIASFGIGNASQIGNIAANMKGAFGIPNWITGVALVILAGLVIMGGIKRIAAVAEKIVPAMVLLYLIGAITIVCCNSERIGTAFASIFANAFALPAVAGGTCGAVISNAITQGFKRGVFSNEAGLGSSVMVHSSSNVKEPVRQGMWGIFEVFADTIVVCTLTALVILTSGMFMDPTTGVVFANVDPGTSSVWVSNAFAGIFGSAGSYFIALAVLLFAFTTVLGWSHYGTKAWEFMFGTKATMIYKGIFVAFIMVGATMEMQLAWDISDTFNGLMILPNLVGVLALSPLVLKITKNYVQRNILKKDVKPMFNANPEIQAEEEKRETAVH